MVSLRILQLEKVLEIDLADFTPHFGLGQAYGEEQQWERVAAAYRKAIEFKQDYTTAAYNGLSNALRALGPTDMCARCSMKGFPSVIKPVITF